MAQIKMLAMNGSNYHYFSCATGARRDTLRVRQRDGSTTYVIDWLTAHGWQELVALSAQQYDDEQAAATAAFAVLE